MTQSTRRPLARLLNPTLDSMVGTYYEVSSNPRSSDGKCTIATGLYSAVNGIVQIWTINAYLVNELAGESMSVRNQLLLTVAQRNDLENGLKTFLGLDLCASPKGAK
jgi:hypothetical protein